MGQLIQIYGVTPPEEVLLFIIKRQQGGCLGITFIFLVITECLPLLANKILSHLSNLPLPVTQALCYTALGSTKRNSLGKDDFQQ